MAGHRLQKYHCHGRGSFTGSHTIVAMAVDQLQDHILSLPWQYIDYRITYYQCHGRGSNAGYYNIIAMTGDLLQGIIISLPGLPTIFAMAAIDYRIK